MTDNALEAGDRLLAQLLEAIAERGTPLHPELAGVLGGGVDPTARASVLPNGDEVTERLRSIEGALAYYSMEGLFIALTPLGMMAVAFALLQVLSDEYGDLPDGVDAAMLDPWRELAPFRPVAVPEIAHADGTTTDASTAVVECGRALWHLARAYDAVLGVR